MEIKAQALKAKQTRPCPECGAKVPLASMDCPECGALILDGAEDLDALKQAEEQAAAAAAMGDGSFFAEDEYPTWEQAMAASSDNAPETASQPEKSVHQGDFSALFTPQAEGPMTEEKPPESDFSDLFSGQPQPQPQPPRPADADGERGMWRRNPGDASRRARLQASR